MFLKARGTASRTARGVAVLNDFFHPLSHQLRKKTQVNLATVKFEFSRNIYIVADLLPIDYMRRHIFV